MTALTLANIPSHINTFERLLVYAAMACQSISNGQQVNVLENQGQQPLVQVQLFKTADNLDRFIVSAYMPVEFSELNSSTEKTWMATKDISTSAPHANLTSN